jgi:hypothetical protein
MPARFLIRRLSAVAAAVTVGLLLFPAVAFAHVPRLEEGGQSLADALAVTNTVKSWAIYGHISEPGQARYFKLDLKAGDRLWLQLFTPRATGFLPALAILGPGLQSQGQMPTFLQVPVGDGVVVQSGSAGEAEYEPFTPGAYYFSVKIDTTVPATGSYYVAVFDGDATGTFGLAVGYKEEFSAADWLVMPAPLLSIYHWEGQGWPRVLAPLLGVLVVGLALVTLRLRAGRRRLGRFGWLAVVAGLFYLGSAAAVLTQMLTAAGKTGLVGEMGITVAFIAIPAVAGAVSVWLGLRTRGAPRIADRIAVLVLAALAVGLFGGYFAGPFVAIVAALSPYRTGRRAMNPVGSRYRGRSVGE